MKALQNYRNLVEKIDGFCRSIEKKYFDLIACRKGCDSCCRHISLFPVEAVNLSVALRRLPADESSYIREKACAATADGPCPLLENGACLLYQARPIICRTHGLPILTREFDRPSVDFCPRNFKGVESLPGNAIIDLDLLNTSLAAINALFVSELHGGNPPEKERLTIAEALLLEDFSFAR
ncbi:MAG TPA: YkgJ family cysteine cluster protein [Geobacteraceae bacterium]|nr:YkgJ family cysteine cluster protein [Geobacteraceae bacterium]